MSSLKEHDQYEVTRCSVYEMYDCITLTRFVSMPRNQVTNSQKRNALSSHFIEKLLERETNTVYIVHNHRVLLLQT